MNRRGGVAALIALAMATFVYLAYVSGVGNMYLPSESVASTTSSPVGRVAIPARIANPSPLAPAPLVDERPEPAPEPRASPAPTSPAVVRDDRKDEGRKLPMECPMVDVADPENVAAVARSLEMPPTSWSSPRRTSSTGALNSSSTSSSTSCP